MKQLDMIQLPHTFSLTTNLTSRLELSYLHAKKHNQLNEAVFPYQDFSLCLQDLLDMALGKEILPHKTKKLERCFEHMLFHKQESYTYWQYQDFSCTLFELLEECMKKVNPAATVQIKQDMKNFHKEYLEFTYFIKKSIAEAF